jgi:DNA polymerase-1
MAVVLVDGSSYLFRAFHALPPLTNSKGRPTGAVKGVINMLRSLQKNYADSKIVVVFDAKGKTFRNDMYSEYKANRPPMPDDLRVQIQPIHDIVDAMGLPRLVIEGVEADDVIGTLARQATEQGIETVVSTGDKDMAQLVSEHVTLINTMTNTVMDREGVVEKFGIPPERIIDYLALMGDKVDNIPGVEKCGPKTAVKWLLEYDSLQGVMDNAASIGGKIGENLRSALEHLPLSYELATIKTDVELPCDLGSIEVNAPDQDKLAELFSELEFKSWVAELKASKVSQSATGLGQGDMFGAPAEAEVPAPAVVAPASLDYQCVTERADFDGWIEKLRQAEIFAFDTETTGLDYMQATIVGVSFAVEAGCAAYVPLAHDYLGAPAQLDRDAVLQALKPLLEDPLVAKVGQNLKYDKHILANHGITLQGIAHDTMLESYVLDSTAGRHDMDSLAMRELGVQTVHFEDIAGKGAKQLTFNQIELAEASKYAAEDADITLRLHQAMSPRLARAAGLQAVYSDIEVPLVPVLQRIERNGTLIDRQMLADHSYRLGQRMQALTEEAYKLAGREFNLSSTKQLGEILFEELQLPIIKKTPKGAPSTAEEVLVELAEDYELPRVLMEFRGLSKLKSTYTDKLGEMVDPGTGRLHTSYHQAVAATGRLSSSDPNLQNIPIRTEEGRKVRQAFIAAPGYKILAADYSQIELRIMAHLSEDEGLLRAFANGEDIHKAAAAEVYGVPLEDVSGDMRRSAKAVNFGLIYGMSAFGLAKQLHIGRQEAQAFIDRYFATYPGVKRYMDNTRSEAAERGYVETLRGRRLNLPEINSSNGMRRQAAERTAINAPMQGTAADIIKLAMLKVDAWLQSADVDARMIMQVHDELVFEVAESQVDVVRENIIRLMSEAETLRVPLLVEAGVGINWDEAH